MSNQEGDSFYRRFKRLLCCCITSKNSIEFVKPSINDVQSQIALNNFANRRLSISSNSSVHNIQLRELNDIENSTVLEIDTTENQKNPQSEDKTEIYNTKL
ncbi:hypothetical protein EDEG_03899 [Edhazardia aedis USNM 41457]|uniref:Uncharacterized protein n=1 Tax=Edhazardia aedis (strain USNM 41457) TaxID=1003232 RepID=J9DFZ7_EDHAE|nr:hypothetical protein EDEG_03899 [Edhazardia aedis USNM 41457]|eukprot:EJW01530.1 hypothetical protein EDEG_03899 [Edhazardia aedis USNM 41457]